MNEFFKPGDRVIVGMNCHTDIRGFTGTVISMLDGITVKIKSDSVLPYDAGFNDPKVFCISAAYIEKLK